MSYDLSGVVASNGKPRGIFPARICSAKIKKSKKGDDMFCLELAIVGKEFAKMKVSDNFMLQGPGAEYAMPKVAFIMEFLEIPKTLDDLTPWLNKIVDVKLGESKDGYTEIKEYIKTKYEETQGEQF